MDYPKPFTITVDGVPIARNKDNGKSQRMAELGNEPAVFMLQNAKLRCIDGYVLARPQTEDLSLIPKPLCWFKDDAAYRTQPTYINQNDGTPALSFGGNMPTSR
jgi:hypothetical protein